MQQSYNIHNYHQTMMYVNNNGLDVPHIEWEKIVRKYPVLIVFHPNPSRHLSNIATYIYNNMMAGKHPMPNLSMAL
jgi:hypothetical protein